MKKHARLRLKMIRIQKHCVRYAGNRRKFKLLKSRFGLEQTHGQLNDKFMFEMLVQGRISNRYNTVELFMARRTLQIIQQVDAMLEGMAKNYDAKFSSEDNLTTRLRKTKSTRKEVKSPDKSPRSGKKLNKRDSKKRKTILLMFEKPEYQRMLQ